MSDGFSHYRGPLSAGFYYSFYERPLLVRHPPSCRRTPIIQREDNGRAYRDLSSLACLKRIPAFAGRDFVGSGPTYAFCFVYFHRRDISVMVHMPPFTCLTTVSWFPLLVSRVPPLGQTLPQSYWVSSHLTDAQYPDRSQRPEIPGPSIFGQLEEGSCLLRWIFP